MSTFPEWHVRHHRIDTPAGPITVRVVYRIADDDVVQWADRF